MCPALIKIKKDLVNEFSPLNMFEITNSASDLKQFVGVAVHYSPY